MQRDADAGKEVGLPPKIRFGLNTTWLHFGSLLSHLRARAGELTEDELDEEAERIAPALIPSLSTREASKHLQMILESETVESCHGSTAAPLLRGLRRVLRRQIALAFALYFLHVISGFAMSLITFRLLEWTEEDTPPQWIGFCLVAALSVTHFCEAWSKEVFSDLCSKMGMWSMVAVRSQAFTSMMSNCAKKDSGNMIGEVSELLGHSALQLGGYWAANIKLWMKPLEICGLCFLLYIFLSWSMFGGLACLVLAFTVLLAVARVIARSSVARTAKAEQHSELLNELLVGLKEVKFSTLEKDFEERIARIKEEEMRHWRKAGVWIAVANAVSNPLADVLSLAFVILFVMVMEQELSPAVLAAYWVLLALLHGKALEFPECVEKVGQGRAALQRFGAYLQQSTKDSSAEVVLLPTPPETTLPASCTASYCLQNAAFAWPGVAGGQSCVVLRGLSLTLDKGELVGVFGANASGKTSLLLGLLGELETTEGVAQRSNSKVAFCPQKTWTLPGTVRENVIMDLPFDEEWYHRVCRACALQDDLPLLVDGDQTLLGDNGVSLSGGQLQRLGLARVVYSRAEVVLLDDPLSALDVRVRGQVWTEAICGLLGGSTRVLVAHDAEALRKCSRLLKVDRGRVRQVQAAEVDGKDVPQSFRRTEAIRPWQRRKRAGSLRRQQSEWKSASAMMAGVSMQFASDLAEASRLATRRMSEATRRMSEVSRRYSTPKLPSLRNVFEAANDAHSVAADDDDESALNAGDSLQSFCRHFIQGAGGAWHGVAIIALLAVGTGIVQAGKYFLSRVADREDGGAEAGGGVAAAIKWYVVGYAAVVLTQVLLAFVRGLVWVDGTRRAVLRLHQSMLSSLLRCPIAAVESVGSLAHQYGQQLSQLDVQVVISSDAFLTACIFGLSIVVCCCIYVYWSIAVSFFCFWAVHRLSVRYQYGSSLQRWEAQCNVQLMELITATVDGLTTIRAHGLESWMGGKLAAHMDRLVRATLATKGTDSWLVLRSVLIADAFFAVGSLGIVLHVERHGLLRDLWSLSPADASFILVNLCFGGACAQAFVVRKLELQGLARVRHSVLEAIRNTPVEGEETNASSASSVGAEWPTQGTLQLERVVLRYPTAMTPTLHGVSFMLNEGDRMSVVGRTGAGKSSVVAAITRSVGIQSGNVLLGGVDVRQVPLKRLREAMSIVGQEAVLFSGTIRSNLDLHGSLSDETIWQGVQSAGLRRQVQSLGGLDATVESLGENFSTGQRQMVCVLRAMLQKRKLILLDEATARLDEESEELVVASLQGAAKDTAVLQIAHRLRALAGSNKVVVMDKGLVVEAGSPPALLLDPSTEFAKLVQCADDASELLQLLGADASRAPPAPQPAEHLSTAPELEIGAVTSTLEVTTGPGPADRRSWRV